MFNHLKGYESVQLPTENIDGKRYYVTPQGNKYLSYKCYRMMLNGSNNGERMSAVKKLTDFY